MEQAWPTYADRLAQQFAPKGDSPYEVFEREYWNVPPSVACVDEINPTEDGIGAEIVCGRSPKNADWVANLAQQNGWIVAIKLGKDALGEFVTYTVTK